MVSKGFKVIVVVAAIIGISLGIYMIFMSLKTPPTPPIPFPPAHCPYAHCVAGSGIVETNTEDIWIGTSIGEIVTHVAVQSGNQVKKGAILFQLDTRTLEAKKAHALAGYKVAIAEYEKLVAEPRAEQIPPLEAAFESAQAEYEDELDHYNIYKQVSEPKAISKDELNRRKFSTEISRAKMEKAKAELDLLKEGSWVKDLEIAREKIKEAKTNVDVIQSEIDRSTVRAPMDGLVLQVNVNEGEYAAAMTDLDEPLVLFGATDPLYIRVNIDEEDVWRVISDAPGKAFVRGNSTINVELQFVRILPFLVPKRWLTGADREKIDVRVLQILYSFDKGDLPIYVGEVLDVFLEGKPNEVPSKE